MFTNPMYITQMSLYSALEPSKQGKSLLIKRRGAGFKQNMEPGRQEWVTVIECICADGTSISSYVIFKGKDINIKWIPDNVPHMWRVSIGENGWISHKHAMEWI